MRGWGTLALCLAAGLWCVCVAAQGPSNGLPRYDVAAETTFQGTVDEVKTAGDGPANGFVRLSVKSKTAAIDVLLAPASVLTEYEFSVAKGDAVEITGSKAMLGTSEVVLVRQITKGDNSLTVRDDKGEPVWTPLKKQ